MKLKLDRIISIATLFAALLAIVLVLKRPAPVVQVQAPAVTPDRAQPSAPQMGQLEQAVQQALPASSGNYATPSAQNQPTLQNQQAVASSSQPKTEAHSSSDGISALLAQAAQSAGGGGISPDADIGGSGEPNIKDQQITYEGDLVHGRFLTDIGGKDVWVTISGHMGSKDGYATFEPTEFKVGDVNVPVSLINPALQRKLAEQHDKLKLPD
jgi:hypothetical protein